MSAIQEHLRLQTTTLPGKVLSPRDLENLARSWIDPEHAERALLRRVDSAEGAGIVGQPENQDCSGVLFPYVWPH